MLRYKQAVSEHAERYVAAAVVIAAVLVGLMWGKPSPSSPAASVVPTYPAGSSGLLAETETVTVHVSGEVVAPGLATVASDARVADAVAAVGGVTPHAHLERINLAAPVHDGDQIVVPRIGAQPETAASGATDGRVRVNSADAIDLEILPGVGPILAEKIVAFREEFGPFGEVEDLLGVPGIGEQKLAAIRELVVVP